MHSNFFLKCCNLDNYIEEPTHFTDHSESVIDLLCTNMPVFSTAVHHIPELGGHAMIYANFKIKKPKIPSKRLTYRSIRDIVLEDFNKDLEMLPWDDISNLNCVNEMVTTFNTYISFLFDKHAPETTRVLKNKSSPWLTSNLREIMKTRNEAHDKYRASKCESDKSYYKSLKNFTNICMQQEKLAFYQSQIQSHSHNSKLLWKNLKKYVLPNFRDSTDIPDHLRDPDAINSHFLNIPAPNTTHKPTLDYFNNHKFTTGYFSLKPVDEETVGKLILAIKSNAQGHDKISREMILLTLPTTLKAMTAILNRSLETLIFPSAWKIALVRPLPKNNEPSEFKDLRPISLLPYYFKIIGKNRVQSNSYLL
ncbi:unnamed protein product [Colias eurytheme]|nr:unnamed protein product [Colias eurytheme]